MWTFRRGREWLHRGLKAKSMPSGKSLKIKGLSDLSLVGQRTERTKRRAAVRLATKRTGPWLALRMSEQVRDATIVFVVSDRGDRYLSTGVFPA